MEARIVNSPQFTFTSPRSGPKIHTISGGDDSNPTWEEYLEGWEEDFRPHLTAIKECIETHNLIGCTGEAFCNKYHFQFDDEEKTQIAFTWRAWGDLMQAIVGKREGYMAYYM